MTHQRGQDGKLREVRDNEGGIFALVEGHMLTPAWSFGQGQVLTPMLQCPVSAIPREVFELLDTWWDSRLLRLPPPVVTPLLRRAWAVFEEELRRSDPKVAP